MAATNKLTVWNAALREIGGAPLANTTDANTRQFELNGAWDHAIEYMLSVEDWGFARRRSTLTGVSDTSFPPYVYRYTKPGDYLRKCWVKLAANDDAQADHAEIAAVFYGYSATVLLEYVSDHADNYEPANWPPHFTKALTLHLAALVAPKLARAGAADLGVLDGKMQAALRDASQQEAVFLTNTSIDTTRLPVMRRALEFLGQQLAGSVSIHAHTDMLRWHMNKAWDHAVRYLLEQGAWNFATRRALLSNGSEAVPGGEYTSIIEGYSYGEAAEAAPTYDPDISEWDYGFLLPDDFLHKIWLKADASHAYECAHQFMRGAVYTRQSPVVMEYVALDTDSASPVNWTANFTEAVAAYLALLVSPEIMVDAGANGKAKINANEMRDKIEMAWRRKLSEAKLKDALQQEAKVIPPGRFASSRMGGTTGLRRSY